MGKKKKKANALKLEFLMFPRFNCPSLSLPVCFCHIKCIRLQCELFTVRQLINHGTSSTRLFRYQRQLNELNNRFKYPCWKWHRNVALGAFIVPEYYVALDRVSIFAQNFSISISSHFWAFFFRSLILSKGFSEQGNKLYGERQIFYFINILLDHDTSSADVLCRSQ